MRMTEIYIALLDESVDVWRPIHLSENVDRIVDQPNDRSTETWQFEPGDVVICEPIASADDIILAATKRAQPGTCA